MKGYYRAAGGCGSHKSEVPGGAQGLGEALGVLFFTAGKAALTVAAGGIRLLRRESKPCGCSSCCETVTCLPPVYSGCCHRCGE